MSVQFEKHQPERRRGIGAYLFCGGGCCCCCCCLHSLGGLIGAAAATARSKSPSEESGIGAYWTWFLLLAGGVLLFCLSLATSALGFGIILALFFLPLAQLVASVLTLIWFGIRSAEFPDKKARLQIIGKITLWSFLGALAGGIAMIVGFKLFN